MLRRVLLALALAAVAAQRAPGPFAASQAKADPTQARDTKMPIDDPANVRRAASFTTVHQAPQRSDWDDRMGTRTARVHPCDAASLRVHLVPLAGLACGA